MCFLGILRYFLVFPRYFKVFKVFAASAEFRRSEDQSPICNVHCKMSRIRCGEEGSVLFLREQRTKHKQWHCIQQNESEY